MRGTVNTFFRGSIPLEAFKIRSPSCAKTKQAIGWEPKYKKFLKEDIIII